MLKEFKSLSNIAIIWNARVSGPLYNNKTPLIVEELLNKHIGGKLILIITPMEHGLFKINTQIKKGKDNDYESIAH